MFDLMMEGGDDILLLHNDDQLFELLVITTGLHTSSLYFFIKDLLVTINTNTNDTK